MLATVNTFREWLLNELKIKGWTQAELSRRAGVSRASVSLVLSEDRSIGHDLAIAIAHALNISPITVFRKAGLLPDGGGENVSFADWEFLLNQMSPEDEAELRQIAELKIERRKKEQSLKTLKTKKAA